MPSLAKNPCLFEIHGRAGNGEARRRWQSWPFLRLSRARGARLSTVVLFYGLYVGGDWGTRAARPITLECSRRPGV